MAYVTVPGPVKLLECGPNVLLYDLYAIQSMVRTLAEFGTYRSLSDCRLHVWMIHRYGFTVGESQILYSCKYW